MTESTRSEASTEPTASKETPQSDSLRRESLTTPTEQHPKAEHQQQTETRLPDHSPRELRATETSPEHRPERARTDTTPCKNNNDCTQTNGEICQDGSCRVLPCAPREQRNAQGQCVCQPNHERCQNTCVPLCRRDQVRDTSCKCLCPKDHFEYAGKCIQKKNAMPPVSDFWPGEHDKTLAKCAFNTQQWWAGTTKRDITFLAFGDPQAADTKQGCPKDNEYTPNQLKGIREALNATRQHTWPMGMKFHREGQSFARIRGALIAGDLTQNGSEPNPAGTTLGYDCLEYTLYRAAFGRCGNEGKLAYPLYDGYGNHDFPFVMGKGDPNYHPVVGYLDRITAAHRPGKTKDLYDDPTPNTGHYAWRWDDIWFVQLNVKAGVNNEKIEKQGRTRIINPHNSLKFLEGFLNARSNNKKRQLVVISHYKLNSSRVEKAEKTAFCKLISDAQRGTGPFRGQKLSATHPVIAYIHGHTHNPPSYQQWDCLAPYQTLKIPHFDVGAPFYKAKKNGPGQLHYTIFRIGNTHLEVLGVGVDATKPTGTHTYNFQRRLNTVIAP